MTSRCEVQKKYILGVDMGTTSIKIVVLHIQTKNIIYEYSVPAGAYIVHNDNRSEQDVGEIIHQLDICVASIPANLAAEIIGIAVCGQLHGVVCWNSEEKPWKVTKEGRYVSSNLVSAHYNWQDNRCTPEFLSSLPKPDSHLSVHTGYGCCTLFWLQKYSPESIRNFNRASTISDFVVAMLCDLKVPKMSPQSAASWGYFNTEVENWNRVLLEEADFPVHLLPQIAQPSTVAGELKEAWHKLPSGIVVGVALGDMQASVVAGLKDDGHALCNISTSGQMIFMAKDFFPSSREQERTTAKIVPYFNGKYIFEGASLNGGNALDLFVTNLHKFLQSYNLSIEKNDLWIKLIENASLPTSESSLLFSATFLGERYLPQMRGKIENITTDNFHMVKIFRSLCAGVITNLRNIIPVETLEKRGITKIVATGSALQRNTVLQLELKKQYKLPIEFTDSGANSPYGAALSLMEIIFA